MTHFDEADGTTAAARANAFARAVLSRFEGLVSPRILEPGERSRQAGAIGGFICAGLSAVLVSPFAGAFEFGMHAVVVPPVAAGLCLGAAAWLAASGRLDLVLSAAVACLSLGLGIAAERTGGIASPLLWLLLAVPAEALLARRYEMAGLAAGLGCLAVGGVALCEWFAMGATAHSLDARLIAGLLALQGLVLLVRLQRRHAARQQVKAPVITRTSGAQDHPGEAVLRFSPDGRLVTASAEAKALFAPDGAPLSAEALVARMHLIDRVRYLKAVSDLRAGGEPANVEIRMQAGAAAPAYADILLRFLAVPGKRGELSAILVIARDVTQERRQTAELGTALDAARRMSEAKTQFLAAVSHELRTPLNAIIGFSDVLDQEFFGGFKDPRQKEYVGLIRQSGEHLLSVVNGLLDVSKIEAGRYELQPESFEIAAALRVACDVMRAQAEHKGLSLELNEICNGASIVADKRAVHQILLNLLSNAVKFTEKGLVTLEAAIEDGMLVICVCDTGIGIESAEIPRLGQPFTQLSTGPARRYQGTGLGLSLVKGLAELHGGGMEIESEFGRGTRVSLRIPLDCTTRIDDQSHRNETIIALNDARKINSALPQASEDRRTA